MPIGFAFLGKPGVWFFTNFPFDLVAFQASSFFLQLFCFGLGTELIFNSTNTLNALFLPIWGLLFSQLLFDFILSDKTLFNRFKYFNLFPVRKKDKLILKNINEFFGGKLLSLLFFLVLLVFYSPFPLNGEYFLLLFGSYILYNSIYLIFADFYLKNKGIAIVLFVLAQGVIMYYGNTENDLSMFETIVKLEIIFKSLVEKYITYFVLGVGLIFALQLAINYKRIQLK